jgi:hypothetical protein
MKRRETEDLRVPLACRTDGATDRLQTDLIAAGGKPGEEALHGKPAEHLA